MRVCVSYDEICTHSYHDGEEYGSWEKSYSSSIEEVYILGDNEQALYCSEVFLLPDGIEKVYVVSMIYNTGDSFGCADGKISIIHCTADEIAAHTIAKMIQENPDTYSFKFTDDLGREINLYNPGSGYFESISHVDVDTFNLGRRKRYKIN